MPTSLLALAIVLLVALIVGLSMALAQNYADARRGATAAAPTTPRANAGTSLTTGPRARA